MYSDLHLLTVRVIDIFKMSVDSIPHCDTTYYLCFIHYYYYYYYLINIC